MKRHLSSLDLIKLWKATAALTILSFLYLILTAHQGQKEIAACAESRFFPLFAINFMYSLMYSLLKIAVSRFLGKIIAIFFCPCGSSSLLSRM